jgi:hypothetical protein
MSRKAETILVVVCLAIIAALIIFIPILRTVFLALMIIVWQGLKGASFVVAPMILAGVAALVYDALDFDDAVTFSKVMVVITGGVLAVAAEVGLCYWVIPSLVEELSTVILILAAFISLLIYGCTYRKLRNDD